MLRRLISFLLTLAIAAALFVVAAPQLVGLERHDIVAQLVAFRGILVAAAVVVAIVLLFAGIFVRPVRGFFAGVAVLLLAFAVVNAGVVVERGTGSTAFDTKKDGDLTVLAWNTKGDTPGAPRIAALAQSTGADVVSLPETSKSTGDQVAAALAKAKKPMQVLTLAYDSTNVSRSTTLLISRALGAYTMSPEKSTTKVLPTVVATPDKGDGPVIVAAHPVSPTAGHLGAWRSGLAYLAKLCSGGNLIMAGDFNSTVDHLAGLGTKSGTLGNCRDAAKATSNAAVGTWPSDVPELLATPIDHVMATPDWTVSGMRVVTSEDESGSDHRPVVAQLTPQADTQVPTN